MIIYVVIWKNMYGEALGCVTEDYEKARKKLEAYLSDIESSMSLGN